MAPTEEVKSNVVVHESNIDLSALNISEQDKSEDTTEADVAEEIRSETVASEPEIDGEERKQDESDKIDQDSDSTVKGESKTEVMDGTDGTDSKLDENTEPADTIKTIVQSPSEEEILLDKKPSKSFSRFSEAEEVRLRSSTIGSTTQEEENTLEVELQIDTGAKFSPEHSLEQHKTELDHPEQTLTSHNEPEPIDVVNNNEVVDQTVEEREGTEDETEDKEELIEEPKEIAASPNPSRPDAITQGRKYIF